MKKVLVFGGTGFVGSHVADALSKAGYQVSIFDKDTSLYLRDDQHFIHGDILDNKAVIAATRGQHYVYHFAGQPDIDIGFKDPVKTIEHNIIGTTNILEACRLEKVERIVFASTIYVYSDAGGFYRASKQACELIIEEYQRSFSLDYTILRYGSLYGRRTNEKNFIHKLLKEALIEKKMTINLDEDDRRDYIHVVDAARDSVEILSTEFKNEHVMLTGHQRISKSELIQTICEILGENIKIEQKNSDLNRPQGRYKMTPYVFKPKISRKFVGRYYSEFGQGLLDCLDELYEKHKCHEL